MQFQAILSNPAHPEYGVATIPFPLPMEEYNHSMEVLEALEIGDAVRQDCKVEEIIPTPSPARMGPPCWRISKWAGIRSPSCEAQPITPR